MSILPTKKASEQTKQQLSDALRKKMAVKLLSKITVQELTAECGLNRQTFYYHFNDIYDLLHWTYERDSEQLVQERVTADTWQASLRIVLRYIEENREMCLSALRSMQHYFLTKFLYTEVKPLTEDLIIQMADGFAYAERFKKFLAHFYTITISALIVDWIDDMKTDVHLSADELVEMIGIAMDGHLPAAIERYRKLYPEEE